MWAVVFGAADAIRANAILNQAVTSDPSWADQSITRTYNALKTVAFQRVGRDAEASAGLQLFAARSQASSRAWDWNPNHAGQATIGQLTAMDLLLFLSHFDIAVHGFVSTAPRKVLNGSSTWVASVRKVKKTDGSWGVI